MTEVTTTHKLGKNTCNTNVFIENSGITLFIINIRSANVNTEITNDTKKTLYGLNPEFRIIQPIGRFNNIVHATII